MRPLKRKNEAYEKGDQKDDGNGVVTHQHHLVKSVTPLQAPSLEGGDEGPVDRLHRHLVEPGKIAVQLICIATDVSENVSHGKDGGSQEEASPAWPRSSSCPLNLTSLKRLPSANASS